VCLVIVELLYVYASAMFKFIEEMMPNFSNIFSSAVVCHV
jgi:ribonuclease HI